MPQPQPQPQYTTSDYGKSSESGGGGNMFAIILEIAIAAVITITLVIIFWILLRINVKRIDKQLTSHINTMNDLMQGELLIATVYGDLLVQHDEAIAATSNAFATYSSNTSARMASDSNYLYPAISGMQQAHTANVAKQNADVTNLSSGNTVFSKLKVGPATVFNDASTGFNIDAGGPIVTVTASNLRFPNGNTCFDFMGGNTGSICGDANNNFLRFKGRNLSTESNMTVGGTLTANGGITVPYGYIGRLLEMSNASGISGMTITDGGGLRAAYPGGINLGATSGGANFKSALEIAATTNAITVPGNLTVGGAFNNAGLTSTLETLNGRMTTLSNAMTSSNAQTTLALTGELATLSARLLSLSNAIVGELVQRPIAAKVVA